MTIKPSYRTLLEKNGLNSLDALFAVTGEHRYAKTGLPGWRERIRLDLRADDRKFVTVYLKRYRQPPLRVQLKRLLGGFPRRGTAWIEWRWLHELSGADDIVARPVAYGQELAGFWERRSFLLMAAVPGQSLERWVEAHPARAPTHLRDGLAKFVRRFHASGLIHRDLYLSHIFLVSDEPPADFRLIDLQRVFRPRCRRSRWIVKDLAALNYSTPPAVATTTDRVRWLRTYWGVRKLTPWQRSLVRRIAAKTRRIARHDRRMRRAALSRDQEAPPV